MPRKYTDANRKATQKYRSQLKQVVLTITPEEKEMIQEKATSRGVSVKKYIVDLTNKDGGKRKMKGFTISERKEGEWIKAHLQGLAAELVEGTPDLEIFGRETDKGTRYYVRGIWEMDDLSAEELQKELSELQEEIQKQDV